MKSTKIEAPPHLKPFKGVEMAILGSGERTTYIKMTCQPGSAFPGHSHPSEQIGPCLEGAGEFISGGETLRVTPSVSWTIPANETHSFVVKGERAVLIYEVWSPPREDYLLMAEKR